MPFDVDGGGRFDLADVAAIWYRRPRLVSLGEFALEADGIAFARDEWRAATEAVFALMDRALWVSHPDRLRAAARKPVQLSLARELGLTIPDTLITNDPERVRSFVRAHGGKTVIKATGEGWISSPNGDEVRYVLTNRLTLDDLSDLSEIAVAPVTLQTEIPKAYEIRVNVVGQQLLPIRIDSQRSERSALDWRRYDVARTPYSPYRLPAEVGRRCLELTRRLGLEFGAIDLIRTPDGDYVFLEINGNGQFFWAEQLSGVPVGRSIAALLAGQTTPLTPLRGTGSADRRADCPLDPPAPFLTFADGREGQVRRRRGPRYRPPSFPGPARARRHDRLVGRRKRGRSIASEPSCPIVISV